MEKMEIQVLFYIQKDWMKWSFLPMTNWIGYREAIYLFILSLLKIDILANM